MQNFLAAVDGTLIAKTAITSIEPYRKGSWGQVVHFQPDEWRWVDPDEVADFLSQDEVTS